MRRAAALAPVSRHLTQQIRDVLPDLAESRFTPVPVPFDARVFFPGPSIKPTGAASIVCVAGLSRAKGTDVLLQALADRRDGWTLSLVGGGDPESYRSLAADLGIADRVRFHGAMPRPAVARIVRAADFVVLPSLGETFGCVLVEALASGKPVVATRCGGPEEIVTADSGLLAEPGDVTDLARCLDEMLACYRDYEPSALAESARARFGDDVVADRLERLYEVISRESVTIG
ncbi:MAG: glycosyltransferase [Chloroflexi bacterium]|nr:glycosyltransferase [Chloroflexota bacterium]